MSINMKAVLLDKPGPPSSLRIGKTDIPVPGKEEALVRVYATSLNPVDYKVARQGHHQWRYPHILGVDVAGVIEAVGEGVGNWRVGNKVFYHTTWRRPGSYAEFNVAPACTLLEFRAVSRSSKPRSYPLPDLTAYSALYRRLHISEGDIAFVHAAAGGVGGFAVQLAKAAKAFVIGTCSGHNKDYVKGLGADEVIDYRWEDVFKRVNEIVGERGVDAIVDTVGPSNSVDNLKLLGPEGGRGLHRWLSRSFHGARPPLFDLYSRYWIGRRPCVAGLS
jgi:NADPH:quinone reductase